MQEDKFKYLEHTADIEFEAYGKDLKELFENSALAFYNSITDLSLIECKLKKEIKVNGIDLVNLLYNFLEELLYLFDVSAFLGKKIKCEITQKNGTYELNAIICGEYFDENKHELKTEIKAVTYHQMRIEKKNEKWVSHVILDI